VAIVVFIVMKKFLGFMQNMRKKEEAPAAPPAPPEPSAEEKLLTEIRDLLKK
jgi:large conductance mechanosensitive channel